MEDSAIVWEPLRECEQASAEWMCRIRPEADEVDVEALADGLSDAVQAFTQWPQNGGGVAGGGGGGLLCIRGMWTVLALAGPRHAADLCLQLLFRTLTLLDFFRQLRDLRIHVLFVLLPFDLRRGRAGHGGLGRCRARGGGAGGVRKRCGSDRRS